MLFLLLAMGGGVEAAGKKEFDPSQVFNGGMTGWSNTKASAFCDWEYAKKSWDGLQTLDQLKAERAKYG